MLETSFKNILKSYLSQTVNVILFVLQNTVMHNPPPPPKKKKKNKKVTLILSKTNADVGLLRRIHNDAII